METAGAIALIVVLLFAALLAVATVRTVRAVKRSVVRGSATARRVVEDNRLRVRRYAVPGPHGEVARLRLDLRASIDSSYRALGGRPADDASLSEAASLLDRLNDHARALDAELAVLEREPDRARLAARLPDVERRIRGVTHSADALRWAAQDRARHFADDELAALHHDIAQEAAALRHWTPVEPVEPAEPAAPGEALGTKHGTPQTPAVPPAAPPAPGTVTALGERRARPRRAT